MKEFYSNYQLPFKIKRHASANARINISINRDWKRILKNIAADLIKADLIKPIYQSRADKADLSKQIKYRISHPKIESGMAYNSP